MADFILKRNDFLYQLQHYRLQPSQSEYLIRWPALDVWYSTSRSEPLDGNDIFYFYQLNVFLNRPTLLRDRKTFLIIIFRSILSWLWLVLPVIIARDSLDWLDIIWPQQHWTFQVQNKKFGVQFAPLYGRLSVFISID